MNSPLRILLVEDAIGMRKIVASLLRRLGYDEVVTANDGMQALQLLQAQRFDLLLTNWNMPVMDGLQLIKQVRASPKHAHIPDILFTSRASRSDVVEAMEVGVDGYLTKPFTSSQLQEQLSGILERQTQRRVAQIVDGLDPLRREEDHALMLVGDAAAAGQLMRPEHARVVETMAHTVDAVRAINAGSSDLQVGVGLDDNSGTLSRQLFALGKRVKALVVTTVLPGSGVTLARLASINKRSDLSVLLVYQHADEIPDKVRAGLERLGVELFERDRLDADAMEQVVSEHVVAKVYEGPPSELPSPEQIRQRLDIDIRMTVVLPVMPQVFDHIIKLSRDPDSEMQQWIDAIETDPLSRAVVIKRARSPIYGFQGEINETDKAVILLGKDAVKDLIVSEAVMRSFQGIEEQDFKVAEYWTHSVSVALTARLLTLPLEEAERTPEQRQDWDGFEIHPDAEVVLRRLKLCEFFALEPRQDPFIAGMMHDIGKVALIHSYPGLYRLILDQLRTGDWLYPMSSAEEICAGGANHCLVGRLLAESWQLGHAVSRVIEYHHQPSLSKPLEQLVAVADLIGGGIAPFPEEAAFTLTRLLHGGETGETAEGLERFVPEAVLAAAGVKQGDIVALARAIAPNIRQRVDGIRGAL
jgi:two-component system chemotaxis response regulator CheY